MKHIAILTIVILGLLTGLVHADTFIGQVVRVTDGDTITVLDKQNRQHRIRLAGIDAPERKQPWGQRSRGALAGMVASRRVTVQFDTIDRYKRLIGKVYQGTNDISLQMVASGNAWVYRKYSSDESLLRAEKIARAGSRGLWSLPQSERIPPWQWRRRY